MKKRSILSAVAAASILYAGAQINSPTDNGYLARGAKMFGDNNYTGCLDQLGHLDRKSLTGEERQQADWLTAQAVYHSAGGAAAMSHFRLFLTNYPYSPLRMQAIARIGDCLYSQEAYDRALKAYNEVDPECLPGDLREKLTYRSAYCLLRTGAFDDSRRRFEMLEHNKTYGNASRFYLGYIAYNEGNYKAAKNYFNQVNTSASPGDMADYYLAQIYYAEGNYGKALSTARALLRRQERYPAEYTAEAYRIAGESLYRQDATSEAVGYLEKYIAMSQSPKPSALYIVGLDKYAEGDYDEAVRLLQPVANSGEDTAMTQSAYLYIGQALHRTGDNDAALLAFDKALKMNHDPKVQEAAFYNFAVAKFGGGNIPFGSSVATFEEFLRRYPTGPYSAEVQNYIVSGYMADNNYEKALEGINRMQNPTSEVLAAKQQVLYTLGARALASDDAAQAVEYLRQASGLSRYNKTLAAETALLAGEAYAALGDNGSAVKKFNEYLRSAGDEAENRTVAYYDLGYGEFALKNYDASERAFRNLLDSGAELDAETCADILNRLGDIRYYASDFAGAAENYSRAYSTNPASGDYALFQNALMQGYMRDYKTKLSSLDKFREQFPTSSLMPDALLETTESLIRLGQNERAVDTYRILTGEYANTAQGRQGYLQMALTQLNMGHKAEAIKAYKDIISLYPTSEEALQASTLLKHIYADDGNVEDYVAFISSVENAPQIDPSEAEELSFESAEKAYTTSGDVSRLKTFVENHPSGSFTARALDMLMRRADADGNDSEALGYANTILERFPDNSAAENALSVKAATSYKLGRGNDALEAWQKLEQKASTPEGVDNARMGIMRVARDLGDYDLVLKTTGNILASSATGAESRSEATFSRALALANTGKRAEAHKLWSEAAANTDILYGAKSAFYLAQDLADNGQNKEALKKAQELTASGTPHKYWLARAFILISDLYAAEGKNFEAKEYLEALKENYPGTESDIFIMIDSRLNK